jgi:DNA primase large subunit
MKKTSWLDQKRQFLSDYFAKKNNGIINISFEEFSKPKENNIVSKYHSWTKLIDESRNLNPVFVLSSLDVHPSGFRTDDKQAQMLLDTAFEKKVDEILEALDEKDLDKSIVQEKLLDYIIANRLYKKRLEELIKKLKNLDPFELQNYN